MSGSIDPMLGGQQLQNMTNSMGIFFRRLMLDDAGFFGNWQQICLNQLQFEGGQRFMTYQINPNNKYI